MPIERTTKKPQQEFPKEAPAPVVLPPLPPVVQVHGAGAEDITAALRSMEQANKALQASLTGLLAKQGKKVIVATIERDSQGRMERIRMEVE